MCDDEPKKKYFLEDGLPPDEREEIYLKRARRDKLVMSDLCWWIWLIISVLGLVMAVIALIVTVMKL